MEPEKLKKRIETYNNSIHKTIFKIIKDNNIVYSENNNGIFVNVSNIDENTYDIIVKYVKYIDFLNTNNVIE